jgi:glycosyltransferase involved in cell wall biosynthesis
MAKNSVWCPDAGASRTTRKKHMIQAPKVSIGMPVYNGERYIAAAIESILGQTERDLELIISDNASTDSTESICREFASRDGRIRYLRNETNIGAHPNYNITFHASSGEFFKWAAHDDVLDLSYIERCLEKLAAKPDSVVCQSFLKYIDENDADIGIYDSRLKGSDTKDPAVRFGGLILLTHPAYEIMGLYRRSALEGSLLLQSFHGADRALLAELSLRGPFTQVTEPLLLVRDHKQRYTQSHVRPKDRAVWHDASLAGKLSLPTWRLYGEYWKMIGRNLKRGEGRGRCYVQLIKWWFVNWNAARMLVDVVSTVIPDFVVYAERLKQRFFSPQPGAGEIRSQRRD